MKKTLVLVSPAVLVLAVVFSPVAAAAPATGTDIMFDGYCDGLHLEIPSIGLPATEFSVDGYQTGCASGGIFGLAKPSHRTGAYGLTKGTEFLTVPGYGTHTVIKRDNTWIHYGLSGSQIFLLNSGTWSVGIARGRSGEPSAASRAGAAASSTGVDNVNNLIFDGYCDGMELVSPSSGLGTAGTVDGHRTGCASDGLMGSQSAVAGVGRSYAVSFFADGVFWLETAIFPDQTWVHYAGDGDLIYVLNSGTWRPGIPQGGVGLSSTG